MKRSLPRLQQRDFDLSQEFFSGELSAREQKVDRVKRMARIVMAGLDLGQFRVVDPEQDFAVNVWVKRGILAYFSTSKATPMNSGAFQYFDKIPVKRRTLLKGVRVVPGAIVRSGSYIEEGAILMPSFVNVGAWVGARTMVDTWATVGSCAYVGADVHLSGGVGIGGVLEPPQAQPVVIEEGAFVGSRCVIVEGVRIGRRAVLGAGVVLTASTKIVDARGAKPEVSKGRIPDGAVVIPGSLPQKTPAGEFMVPCALVIGNRSDKTDLKTSLNAALREFGVAV